MCLAVPHVIESVLDGSRAVAVAGAVRTEIRTDLIENALPGDTVLVHAGFAIEKLAPDKAGELSSMWERLRELAGEN